jgi:UDP-2,4-diacetamido-2,4,6-trideoxy-beta-L-altropyranose hydrolase
VNKVLIRADSSSMIGTGHIMRDLVLAKQYPESEVIFATQNLEGNINSEITKEGYGIETLKSNDLEELVELIQKLRIDMIIIDHYAIDAAFEKALKDATDIQIMVVDDTYEKHHCDILLNHNVYAEVSKYKGLVPVHCELRCGSRFTLIRDEFKQEKEKKRIFVAMGGSDHSNINIQVLKVLEGFSHIEVNLVTTTANKHLKELQAYAKDKIWVHLHVDSNELAKLMKISDFAIVTPSVTLNEVFYMGLPFVAIQTADNQKYMYDYLCDNRANVLDQFSNNELEKHIKLMLKRLNNG